MEEQKTPDNSFKDFVESSLSKKQMENLHFAFNESKKWVTMKLKNPDKIRVKDLIILLEITGKSFEEFKPYFN